MQSRLKIIGAEQGPRVSRSGLGGSSEPGQLRYKLVVDKALKAPNGKGDDVTYTPNALALEGVLVGSAWRIDVGSRWSTASPYELWLEGQAAEAPPLPAELIETLNGRIDQMPVPHVRIVESESPYPGLLYAHRDVAIGPLAVSAICDLEVIKAGETLPTGSRATTPEHRLYDEDTLAAFLVRPQFDMAEAAAAVSAKLQF